MKVAASHAGRKGRCPKCGSAVLVPAAPPAEPVADSGPRRLLPPVAGRHDDEEMIDMTAMVDIVFFLLIFFMVTSLGMQQASIELPRPSSTASASQAPAKRTIEDFEADEDYVIVRIDRDNSVWVEDAETLTSADLHERLREIVNRQGEQSPHVLVLGSGDAEHGTAVMVLDAAHDVGISDVRLAVEESEDNI